MLQPNHGPRAHGPRAHGPRANGPRAHGPRGAQVAQGVKNGSLSADEVSQIRASRQQNAELRKTLGEDGVISPEERGQLREARANVRNQISQLSLP